ncbi:S1C family serine protease [Roseomonas marmotae]|uniref:Serine protease n=1 Tax=Roseomonas marmotae TaxID=2768161 RepID=A0ABS3KDJ6_9PROT|nr:S1C family serine protease [Roseomonas marmotae]MBO1075062.1 serine protease [Roseomonas marmotae]QTI79907.1 serine protease [Roseomonas marmotae]
MAKPDEDEMVPVALQPQPGDYAYDLDHALSAVVTLHARVPEDAFTAGTLGTERLGNAVLIRESGLLLTIGYLVTEAEEIWLTTAGGRVVAGHVMAYDQVTGFGLVQALGPLGIPALALGESGRIEVGARIVFAGAGGRPAALAGRIIARQEFAGYWEYLLDEAIFTAPAHPHWGGAALIGPKGDLIGIGSLQLGHDPGDGRVRILNMSVPTDLLKPILEEMLMRGRANRPPRPWLGVSASSDDGQVVLAGVTRRGPAARAGLREGDVILAVAQEPVNDLAAFLRGIWSLGEAGVDIPLVVEREGDRFEVRVTSGDRQRFLKSAPLH